MQQDSAITIVHEQQHRRTMQARADGERLWLAADEVEAITGWACKPEGLCRGEVCIPLSASQRRDWIDGDRLDVASVWRHVGHPVVHDDGGQIWVLGAGAESRAADLAALQGVDFTLPDLDGHAHRFSDYRGSKVLLATWASW